MDMLETQKTLIDFDIGVWALGTFSRRPYEDAPIGKDVSIKMGDVTIRDGHYIYADADGIIAADDA